MGIEVSCLHCRKRHKVTNLTVRLSGPIIYVTCPFCRKETIKNFGSFLEAQINNRRDMGRFEVAQAMISLAKIIKRESY